MTDRYAVVGNPVAHSRSPDIHAMFAEQTGQRLSYERLLAPLDAFEATLRAFAAAGGRGCNITVPFKFDAFALAAKRTERAQLGGAVNTLRFDETSAGGWTGDNTDGAGLVNDIQRNAGRSLAGVQVLLVGAGGAAAGVLGSLIAAAPARITIVNRTLDKAQALVANHAHLGVPLSAGTLTDAPAAQDIVVNATSTSLAGAGSPVDARVLARGALALDMMYGPKAQGFLDWAATHGAEPRDGLGMLIEQAAEAFFFWRGVRPDTAPVLKAMRTAL
ncbi:MULTISPECIES: shikimate dehydrogenase [unclassified Roseateles]|uniref:shikimate dehydrogenase n=1 Tax=unclassified Roseateles TaxID=2626991 RepID=UPI0006FF5A81|nr:MULTISPECIES: shikimate dehydrogenase [unclassified Roseateles]KQW51785.1 shikimate dehydrogenase [Pelomonas sp. Root405]KRA78018.1 shikimate dehydrogenase [Pelomonas sp. Root662]